MGDRIIHALDEGRAHAHAHGPTHEGEILHAHDQRHIVDRAPRVDQCVMIARRQSRRLDPVGITLAVAEFQRIFLHMRGRQQDEAGVQYMLEPLRRADTAMMAATRAHGQIFFPFLDEDHLRTGWAFVPQRFGGLFLLGDEGDGLADAVDPAHAAVSRELAVSAPLRAATNC